MKTGFEKFLEYLDLYLELLNNPTINKARIRIYRSVTLSNGTIVHTTSNFHNREWFSEVAILKNQTIIYQTKEFGYNNNNKCSFILYRLCC